MEGGDELCVFAAFFTKIKSMKLITTSPNIATLDSKIVANQCDGNFLIDLSPSVWIASGKDNVLGSKVKLVNPYGVTVRDYPSNFDAAPSFSGGMDAVTSISIPTQAGNYQYGKYSVYVQLTDADGTIYEIVKYQSICAPNTADKGKKYGNLGVKLTGICNQGKVYVLVDEVPTYKGLIAESSTQNFTLDYPTGSGLPPISDTTQGAFSVPLFEGVYKLTGNVCATYNYGDNVYAQVPYQVNYSKAVICSLDEGCVFVGLAALYEKLNSDCSEEEKNDTRSRIERAALLKYLIDTGVQSGEDVSDYIQDLEDVLGQTCSCDFNNGTPIVNNNPAEDVVIQGCNVEREEVGLTTTYTINNYSYSASVSSNGGILNISNVVLNGCAQSQNITFNINNAYTQIRQLANASLSQAQYWAAIVMKVLRGVDAECLGITTGQLATISLDQFIQKIIDKACAGAGCDSIVNTIQAIQDGGDVVVSWTQTGASYLDIYVDGVLVATALSSLSSYRLNGFADGVSHTYQIVSKCGNGVLGSSLQGTFGYAGCPVINAPAVSSSSVSNATCPFDLTGLVSGLPTGIEAEWHTANNHLPTSLVPDPTNVSDGIYYVFGTDGDNCYSNTGTKVIVTCAVASSCSAPQNLSVSAIIGGFKVYFKSALYPPSGNSYTVKRKDAAAPDVDANYTTIGTPVFNASSGKWEITDNTAANNTLYTYKAISNCDTPRYILLNFANIVCPSLSLTSDEDSISYSFAPAGGQVDKYEVEIWNSAGTTKLHTDTFLPALSNPTTGMFTYLSSGTSYKIRLVSYIGDYSSFCPFVSKSTVSVEVPNTLVISNASTDIVVTNVEVNGNVPSFELGGLPISSGEIRNSTDNLDGGTGTADIYVEYDFTASNQSITIVDTNDVSTCVDIVTEIAQHFNSVDLSGSGTVRIYFNALPCGQN